MRTGVLQVAVALQRTCVVAVVFVLAMYSSGSSNTLQYSSGSSWVIGVLSHLGENGDGGDELKLKWHNMYK